MHSNKTVLLVSKQKFAENMQKALFLNCSGANIIYLDNVFDVSSFIEDNCIDITLAVVDFTLSSMLLKILHKMQIPTIVLLEKIRKNTYDTFEKYNIVDFVSLQSNNFLLQTALSTARFLKNYESNILIVDDSRLQLKVAQDILENQNFNVYTAHDGAEALALVQKGKIKFSLVLTDYNMPKMDGLELTIALRENYAKDEMGIIVLSGSESSSIIEKFIRIGANDFIGIPYVKTEVLARVNANLEILDLFEHSRNLANRDYMTGAYNRRFFFESGRAIVKKAQREKENLCIAMLDIDKFKDINDNYGHDVGDATIKELVRILNANLRNSDLMARFGGEEFCVLLDNITLENAKILFEKIRKTCEMNILEIFSQKVHFSVSIGVQYGLSTDLESMIRSADDALYYCKENGRNQIHIKLEEMND